MNVVLALFGAIPKWVWVAIVAALSATSCKLHYTNGQLEIEVNKAATKLAQADADLSTLKAGYAENARWQATQYSIAVESNRKKEQDLQLALNTERKKTNEAVNALIGDSDAVRLRLLKSWGVSVASRAPQASVTSAATGVAEVTPVSDGAQLPSAIGDLIDEAKRADTVRLELLGCYRSYDEAREKLKPELQSIAPEK